MTRSEIQHHARAIARLHNEGLDPFTERARPIVPILTERRVRQHAYKALRGQIRGGIGPRFFGAGK